jgi:membrane-bound lytic murein transglycosylase A
MVLHSRSISRCALVLFAAAAVLAGGCDKAVKKKPDYNRPLPPGASALRLLLDFSQWPNLREPFDRKDAPLMEALDRSITWYTRPSSKQFFPLYDVTHVRARTSTYAMKKLLESSATAAEFEAGVRDQFNCYTSVGYDDTGSMLYTGYFTPIFKGSKTPTAQYSFPLYKKPPDLKIDPVSGKVLGRDGGSGTYTTYPSRAELEKSDALKGLELVYVATRLDQYVIQVNGSAKIDLADGSSMYIGYSGNNGHEYTGLGATLLKEGVIPAEKLSLAAIRAYFAGKEDQLEKYIARNERFVFFTEYDGTTWPAGSLNVKVTPLRTLATDKEIFPRGAIVVVNTKVAGGGGAAAPEAPAKGDGKSDAAAPVAATHTFNQFMLDQDTGGAIRAAGRGDIYMGIGPEAEQLAGAQFAEGRLYYFFLKNDRVLEWNAKMLADPELQKKPAPATKPPVLQ